LVIGKGDSKKAERIENYYGFSEAISGVRNRQQDWE